MAYMALYRKWRPSTFEDVKGQDHIVTALKNQIQSGRIGHAYLFCGTRGTGKTTIAKIFARAVNCERPEAGSPCGNCASCRAIAAGVSMNVVEMDAASNNGVDDIRGIREELQYSPTEGRYRVYIIDEVHMLSTAAFNALLKTLEEPPSYVIFILATTEANKIPITVLSRCQRYDFRRIRTRSIYERLQEMTQAEGLAVEDRALRFLARKGDGSLRDAISLLDQCIAFHYGQTLTYEQTLDVLGAVDGEVYSRLLREIVAGETVGCLNLVEEISARGREIPQFVSDFVWYLRNLMLQKAEEGEETALELSGEDRETLEEDALLVELPVLMRYLRILSELSASLRYSENRRILLEMALIRMIKPEMEQDMTSLLQRIGQLEEKLERAERSGGIFWQGDRPGAADMHSAMAAPVTEKRVIELEPAAYEDYRLVQEEWRGLLREMSGSMPAVLGNCRLEPLEDGRMRLWFCEKGKFGIGSREEVLRQLQEYVAQRYGKRFTFVTALSENGSLPDFTCVSRQEVQSKILMEFETEE